MTYTSLLLETRRMREAIGDQPLNAIVSKRGDEHMCARCEGRPGVNNVDGRLLCRRCTKEMR